MKRSIQLLFILLPMIIIGSCKKDNFKLHSLGAIKIVNTITGGTTARLNGISTTIPNSATTGGTNFGLLTGTPDIYVWPTTDTLNPYYNSNKAVTVTEGDYYTLFLGGTPSVPEGILVKENYQNYTDSVMGIRFINLSPNSTPVNVTLSTSTTVNEFANIPFKTITDFKIFPATKNITSYTFQVRRASNPTAVLSSATISFSGTSAIPRFKNVTLVFRGNVGGSPAPGITRVNHY